VKRTLLVVSILVLLCAAAHGVTWTVDWVGGGDFLTIEEGLFAAAYGDTVYVLAGYYNEHVLMKDGVCLLGEGADCTIVDGTGWDFSTITCDGTFGPDTIIEGFRIQNGNGPYWSASGVWLGIDCSAVVQYNVMIGNTMGGMVNYNDGNPVIDHNTIVFNNDCGIQIYVGNDTIVTGVATITNNIIFDNGN